MSIQRPPEGGDISRERIATALAPFQVALSDEQIYNIQEYVQLLLKWNQAINLTAIDDLDELLARHFGESIFAASFLRFGASRLADVGTGPGFPGLPLKIACPDMRLTLIESNAKKCAFLAEVVLSLGLSQVEVIRSRYQDVSGAGFDIVCSRALGNYGEFLPWARQSVSAGGRTALWVGTDESIRIGRSDSFRWEAPVPIPESRRRVMLIGYNDS
jgi:16S rRNA (guanine527-N7)-methyltransferase